jgi:hypothetical protein
VNSTNRKLRLRTTAESMSFNFRPELVKENGIKRITEFLSVYQQMNLPRNVVNQLRDIETKLIPFGYQYRDISPLRSVFDPWEIK